MLQQIERDPPVFIQGDRSRRREAYLPGAHASAGDMREWFCEEISSPGPKRDRFWIPAGKTAVSVELDLVESFLTLGKFLKRERIHGLDEPDLCFWQRVERFRVHSKNNVIIASSSCN